jgi:hypothetical protein
VSLGETIRKWVTSLTAEEARNAVSEVFEEAWSVAEERYGLLPLPALSVYRDLKQ